MCLSIVLSICRLFYISIYLSIYLSIDLSVYTSIYRAIYLSVYRSIYLSVCLSVYLSIYLSIIYLFIDLSICPYVYLYIYLSTYLSKYMSVYISIYIRSCLFYLCGYDNTACEYFRLRKFFYAIVSFVLGIIKMLATRRLKTFILYFLFYTKSSRGVLLAIYLVVTQFL